MHERPHITSMIGSLANYSNTIPSAPDGAADGDAKPAAPAARMGKSEHQSQQHGIQISAKIIIV